MAHRLTEIEWRPLEAAHHDRVDARTAAHLNRRQGARKHPVEDFLFTYYMQSPAQLRRWHPGPGVVLEGAVERGSWKFYRYAAGAAHVDLEAFLAARSDTVRFVRDLLTATAARPAHLGCLGLHEWAMVYRQTPEQLRHDDWPLRLGSQGTDAVVESHQIRCSHLDAIRFFTPAALPLNTLAPSRNSQVAMEQPGCLHANMDLYKWAYKLSPATPSALTLDCLDLAREVRELDMRAAPYDLRPLGYEPVEIETPAGKAEYVAAQRDFATRAQALRWRLIDACDALLPAPPAAAPRTRLRTGDR
ncbi:MAG: 3-methyladenine DNA glycosylase [Dermatophilaceae bacterium]